MPRRVRELVLGFSAFCGLVAAWSGLAGCEGAISIVGSSGGGGATSTAIASSAEATGNSAVTSGVTSGSVSSSASTGAGTSGSGGASPMDATITEITTGVTPPGVKVKLTGVVAMSRKHLVSKGTSGSCLWGVYVSEPNLAETQASSGLHVLSYGINASIKGDGGTAFCPVLGQDAIGDSIPDNTKPGDVLDVLGESADFILAQCLPVQTFGEPQVSKVNSVVKTGTAPVPTAHVMSAADLAKLVPSGDPLFQSQWACVKIRIQDVVSEPRDDGGTMAVVDKFGNMLVHDTSIPAPALGEKLEVSTRLFWFFAPPPAFCSGVPLYANPTTTFSGVEGIGTYGYPNQCQWILQAENRCLDFNPPSDDCTNPMACN